MCCRIARRPAGIRPCSASARANGSMRSNTGGKEFQKTQLRFLAGGCDEGRRALAVEGNELFHVCTPRFFESSISAASVTVVAGKHSKRAAIDA